MRKIRIIEQISLDGVIQAPGGRDEGGDDYAHGGWAMLWRRGTASLSANGLANSPFRAWSSQLTTCVRMSCPFRANVRSAAISRTPPKA
jgi:hypothetical protein